MKVFSKYFLVLAFSSLLLTLTSYNGVYAVGISGPKEKAEQVKENMQNRQEKREEIREKLSATKRERVRNLFGKMITRYEAYINRLSSLIERIESRITKIKEEDPKIDVSSVQTQISKAKDLLVKSKSDLEGLKSDFEALVTSDSPLTLFKDINTKAKTVRDGLVEIHRILVKVIGDIKGLRVGENK